MSLIDGEVGIAGGMMINGQVLPRSQNNMRSNQPAGVLTYIWGASYPHELQVVGPNGALITSTPRPGEISWITAARAAALTAQGAVLTLIP